MKRILKPWSILALAGLLWNGGMSAVGAENVPKLPVAVHDTAFYADFEDEACMEDWLVVDANEDGNSWNWVSGSGVGYSACLQFRGNGRTPDDWAISPVFALESGRTYKLSYFYNMLYYNEKVEVYLGTARETASMGRMLSSQDVTTYGWASTVFSVEESGNYCLGIKAASEAVTRPGLYIDEVSVCEEILGTVPGPVQDLTQVPGENGALTMGLSWTNPSADEAGNALQSLSGIEIYKNYGNDNIAGSLNLQAGAQVTWTDPDPQPGKVVYHVYAVNASGRSYAASVNTYVGEDLPSAPRNLQAEVSGSTVNLSWEAPGEFGLNGGWYDPSGLSYIVARSGQNYIVLDASATGTSFTDNPEGMDMYYYEVTAKSASGQGGKAVSGPLAVGNAMQLPFSEDFEDPATLEHLWTVNDIDGDLATWYIEPWRGNKEPRAVYWNFLPAIDPYGDYVTPEADDWLFSPLLEFEAGKTYRLSYSLAGPMMGSVSLRVALGKTANPTAMTTPLENLNAHGTGGSMSFEDRSIEFEAPGSGSFCIGFYYYGYEGNGYCWLDDILVEEVAKSDLAVISLKGMSAPKVGEAATYTVEVENKGGIAARNFHLQLLDDAGQVLVEGAEQTRPLSAGRTQEYTLNWTPSSTDPAGIQAKVVYAEDLVEGNNASSLMPVNIQGDGFKAVEIGEGEVLSYDVPWYVYNTGFGQTVYPSDLLEGVVGRLNGFAWHVKAGLEDTLRNQNFRIWVGETDRTDMMAGWFGPDELSCVLDTAVEIVPGIYEWYLPFQRPYDYKGGNIVVCIEGTNSYGDLGSTGLMFECTESGTNAVSRSNYGDWIINMENLDNTQGMFFSLRPDITFYFDVQGMGSLEGTVSDEAGSALGNVRVQVNGLNSVQRTDAQGSYAFPYVPVGNQSVDFTLVGYEDATETVSVAEGQTATLDIRMQNRPVVSVRGVVAGSDSHEGLALAELVLDGPSDYTVTTEADGSFEIADVYGNLEYGLNITASGYSDYAGTLAVGSTDLDADTIFIDRMVNMPSAVHAYDRADHALVEWEEPVPVAWLQLDDGELYGSFGGNSDAAYLVGHRYTPEDFAAAGVTSAQAVTKVRFFPVAVAGFTLKIYAGEEGVESLVYEEEMNVEEYETWFEHTLTYPVAINPEQCMIVAISVQQSSGSNPIGFDRGPAALNASLFSEDDGLHWVSVSEVSPSMNYNWLIHTYCSADPNSQPADVADLMNTLPGSGIRPADFLSFYASASTGMRPQESLASKETTSAKGEYAFELLSRAERRALNRKAPEEPYAGAEYSYEVFRLLNGQELQQDLWTRITGTPVLERSVRDESWAGLQDTMYRYAVRSVLQGVYSDFTFSTAVDKGKYSTVSLSVTTNTGEPAGGAIVSLLGLNNIHSDTVGADGRAEIADVHFGTYELRVSKEYFRSYSQPGIVLDENAEDLGSVELIEDVRPPREFTATDWLDRVELAWEQPARLVESILSKTQSSHSTGYGMNYGGTMEIGQRFTPEELQAAGVDGYYIRSISFWPDASADFTVKVWKSDAEGQEREFYAQTVTSDEIVLGQWNTIALDEPVLINADQYYIIGYSAYMSAQAYPCGADAGPLMEGGDMLFYNGEWSSFCGFAPGMYDFNWMIEAVAANDGSVAKTLSKADEELDYTYELFRLPENALASPASWTRLQTGENFRELSFTDESWASASDGNYFYAIYSRSSAGNTSDTVYSEMLPKGEVSLVTVSATTNNGTSAAGASVRLVSQADTNTVYAGVLDENGSVQIPAVRKGSYVLRIAKAGFDEYVENVEISEDRTSLSGKVLEESLLAPLAVRALMDEAGQVRVDWWSPMEDGLYPHYITYSTGEFFTGIGQGENAFNFSAAHRYTVADLQNNQVAGSYVTKIRFYPASTPSVPTEATFSLGIWEGEEGTQVLRQSVPASAITYNEWCEVELNTPYHIEGDQTLYFGYTCQGTRGWMGGIDYGPAVRGKGNMINVDGSWMRITDLSPDMDYNWMIEVYCTDAAEAGVESKAAKAEDFVESWSVYRLTDGGQERPASWTELASETTEMSLTDNLSGQADDWYLYAVEAHYATGVSEAAFSNILGKGVGNEASLEAAASMSVTPNPNRGQFSLEVPFEGEWKVFDLKGRLVMKRHLSEGTHSMDVDLEAGNYLMVLDSGTVQVVGKLVIL